MVHHKETVSGDVEHDMTGANLGMSREAINWALRQAPDVPPQCVSVLIGLADAADSKGCGAFLGQQTLAEYARKSDRQVRSDLLRLGELGLIRRGDQSKAGHIPADARPIVWNLAMDRKRTSGRKPTSGRKHSSVRPEADPVTRENEQGGGSLLPGGSTVPGGSTASRGRKPTSDKPSTNKNQDPTDPAAKPKHATADALAAAFWDRHKAATAQSFIAVRGVIRTAIANGLPRDDVARALDRLAKEGRAISGGSITTALAQMRNPNGRAVPSTLPPNVSPRQEHRYRR